MDRTKLDAEESKHEWGTLKTLWKRSISILTSSGGIGNDGHLLQLL